MSSLGISVANFVLAGEFLNILQKKILVWIRIQIQQGLDPDPGSGAFLTPGSGIRDEQPGSYFRKLRTIFCVKILKFFDADPGPGMEKIRIWDPGPGMEKILIRDKHPGSTTL
jgi:hypothetical protein